ncbi:winged helix DNA-binding domain-containing protein [Catenuloplanes japonicus]|uniref:winged helix DNA-binding domain-containing protein n=1 Tax=Catenuloplanes japonicus TaxID=33876 RepID=UPI000527CE77|nr:winged helix DNA-binding domain-containing protein [Catenuloplanes japonicus]
MEVTREQVLGFRIRAQQLDRAPGTGTVADTAVLDYGVQDTGPDGAAWALTVRGLDDHADLSMLWTLRGGPHLYRRADLPDVAAAVAPFSDEDAGKRIYDASKPLRQAGIGNLEGLDQVAAALRKIVTKPTVKGDASGRLSKVLDAPHLRACKPCGVTHAWEMPFRLAAIRAGLELQPGTSPPVLQRIPGFSPAKTVKPQFDVIRTYLRLLGPATPKQVAAFLDSPVKEVTARWPADVTSVTINGRKADILAEDAEALTAGPAEATRLLGPYDLFLQAKDRDLLVDDPARAKEIWPVLGRPGIVLADGDLLGTWRPRKQGKKFRLEITLWAPMDRTAIEEQAERLAAFRGVQLTGLDLTD